MVSARHLAAWEKTPLGFQIQQWDTGKRMEKRTHKAIVFRFETFSGENRVGLSH